MYNVEDFIDFSQTIKQIAEIDVKTNVKVLKYVYSYSQAESNRGSLDEVSSKF